MRRATDKDRDMLMQILETQGPQAAMRRLEMFRDKIHPQDIKAAEMAIQRFAKGGDRMATETAYMNAGGMVYNRGGVVGFGTRAPMMNTGGAVPRRATMDPGIAMALEATTPRMYNLGGKVSKIYNEGYKAPGQAYAIAKSMGYNHGGPVHMQQGGMTPGMSNTPPMMREGPQHDTVDARLTPGEFVIDADSTAAIQRVAPGFLDNVNQWEPTQGMNGLMNIFNSLDDVAVTKTDKSGNKVSIKSPEGSRMMTLFGGS